MGKASIWGFYFYPIAALDKRLNTGVLNIIWRIDRHIGGTLGCGAGSLFGLYGRKIQKKEMFTKETEISTYMVHG